MDYFFTYMIALITDFGTKDNYAGIVKGVIKSISPETDIIDITHSVKPFSIVNAQYILYSSYRYFPEGTIFYVVIDPGVGSARKALIAKNEKYIFVMPDNGILSAVYRSDFKIFEINYYLFKEVSATFHGRDIFAPIAAMLRKGRKPEDLGSRKDNFIQLKFPQFNISKHSVSGNIIHSDIFGNIITSIPNEILNLSQISNITVKASQQEFIVLPCRTYSDLNKNTAGILYGSSGFIELALNTESLSEKYNIDIENTIRFFYENQL